MQTTLESEKERGRERKREGGRKGGREGGRERLSERERERERESEAAPTAKVAVNALRCWKLVAIPSPQRISHRRDETPETRAEGERQSKAGLAVTWP